MKYVDTKKLENLIWITEPFGHVVIDDFLKDEYLPTFLEELSALKPDSSYYHGSTTFEHTKQAFKNNLGSFIDSVFEELCGDEFISFLETLSGIQGIIRNNRNLSGAGIHKVYHGGFLTMHKDFNHTQDKDHGLIDRRINLLLYMNPDWKDEFNGQLCLYDEHQKTISKKIAPLLNRCVIFNTTDAIHGHPTPLQLPPDRCRQSLALYYYTKNVTGKAVTGNKLAPVQWYKNIQDT